MTRMPRLVRDVRPHRAAKLELPPGEYGLRVALRVEVASETLAGVYATHTIPDRLEGSDFGPLFSPSSLRTVMTGIPDGVEVGSFHITSAPSVETADSVEHAILVLPFRLEFVRPSLTERMIIPALGRVRRRDA